MTKRTVYYVQPYKRSGYDWAVKKEGSSRISSKHRKKKPAIRKAKSLASQRKPSQIIIQKSDGQIQTEHTYGSDPERYDG